MFIHLLLSRGDVYAFFVRISARPARRHAEDSERDRDREEEETTVRDNHKDRAEVAEDFREVRSVLKYIDFHSFSWISNCRCPSCCVT